ncbi:hypothetical protein FACS1894167_01710 [Synergistales bacterium]|nr:hypothetical protein FACS1894167_01710 [Synergistales bacterium]
MLNMAVTESRPALEVPAHVWDALRERDFVNFPVPLLNPPAEEGGVPYWSGYKLTVPAPGIAAFARDEDAALYMPYGEMFRIITGGGENETPRAQIYGIFFEEDCGEWQMIYRLVNCDRVYARTLRPMPGDAERALPSNWMLTLSGVENWLTLDAYLNYYCKYQNMDSAAVGANIYSQISFMEGSCRHADDARVMPMPGGVVLLVSRLSKDRALMYDAVNDERLARFVMDDPAHLIDTFWRLQAKVLLNASDMRELNAMISDARHFVYAKKSAREQGAAGEEISAAAFYCECDTIAV